MIENLIENLLQCVAMLPALGAALVSGAGSLFSNVFNVTSQERMNQNQMEFAEKMYNRQVADQRADIAMQNAYNTPASQVARLRAAGINPVTAYSNMQDVQQSTPSYSQGAVPNLKAPSIDNPIGDGMSTYLKGQSLAMSGEQLEISRGLAGADVNLKSAQALNNLAQADEHGANTEHMRQRISTFMDQFNKDMEYKSSQIGVNLRTLNEIDQRIRESESRVGLNDSQRRKVDQFVNEIAPLEMSLTRKQINELDSIIANTEIDTLEKWQRIEDIAPLEMERIAAQTRALDSQSAQAVANANTKGLDVVGKVIIGAAGVAIAAITRKPALGKRAAAAAARAAYGLGRKD